MYGVNLKNSKSYALKITAKEKYSKIETKIYNVLKKNPHPNIIQVYDIFQNNKDTIFVLDMMWCGDLYEIQKNTYSLRGKIKEISFQIGSGINHLHKHNITHRDIKLENILLNDMEIPKICDFGLAIQNKKITNNSGLSDKSGTLEYMAPEIFSRTEYGYAVDWWSFGIILYEVNFFKLPWSKLIKKNTIHSILYDPLRIPSCSKDLEEIILKLLQKNPVKRLTKWNEIKNVSYYL